MTRIKRDEVLITALVLSLVVHIVLMAYVRSRVMTHGARGVTAAERHGPARFMRRAATPNPTRPEELLDLEPVREPPPSRDVDPVVPQIEDLRAGEAAPAMPAPVKVPEAVAPKEIAPTFSAPVVSRKPTASTETPPVIVSPLSDIPRAKQPSRPAGLETSAVPPPSLDVPFEFSSVRGPGRGGLLAPKPPKEKPPFVPAEEVFEKVDEKIVAAEKQAVRDLLDGGDAEGLASDLALRLVTADEGAWRYFLLYVTPRRTLATVPKDVVVLIDASGSIGRDRMGSIRSAGKRILRSAANTGDRFNLVAFRDRYAYAFKTWQPCTQQTFDAADKWFNGVAPFGRTDVFGTIASVLTLPRDPKRPLVALVVTDGEATSGVRETEEILARFTALNDGLVSVYMYGVKESANRPLVDLLTHANRGEGFVFTGMRWNAGDGIEKLTARFRDPVLSDLRLVFTANCPAETYPRALKNLYRGETLEIAGRIPVATKELSFSLKGLHGAEAREEFYRLPLAGVRTDAEAVRVWRAERELDVKIREVKGSGD